MEPLIINQHTNRIDRHLFPFLSDLTLKRLSFRYPVLRSNILQIYSSYLNDPCSHRYSHPWSRAVDLKRTQHDVVNNSIRNLIRASVSEERNLCPRESTIRLSRWKTIARKLRSIQLACVPIEMENEGWREGEGKIFCGSSDGFGYLESLLSQGGGENLLNRDTIASVHAWKIAAVSKEFRRIPDLFQSRNITIFRRNSLETQNSFPSKNISNLFPIPRNS